MADKKTFTVNVNGIDKAYDQAVNLKDVLDKLNGSQTDIYINIHKRQINSSQTDESEGSETDVTSSGFDTLDSSMQGANAMSEGFSSADSVLLKLNDTINRLIETLSQFAPIASKITELTDKSTKSTEKSTEATGKNVESTEELGTSLEGLEKKKEKINKTNQDRTKKEQEAESKKNENILKALETELLSIENKNKKEREITSKQYDDLITLAAGNTDKQIELTKNKNEHLKALDEEHQGDRIEALEKSVNAAQEIVNAGKTELTKSLESLQVKNDNGILNLDKTKKNWKDLKKNVEDVIVSIKKQNAAENQLFDEQEKMYAGNKDMLDQIAEKRTKTNDKFKKDLDEQEQKVRKTGKAIENIVGTLFDSIGKKIISISKIVTDNLKIATDSTSGLLKELIKEYKEKAEEIKKEYDGVVAKKKESEAELKTLEEEAKNASGGRAIVLQEQIARKMEANAELAKQEKELAKQKADADKKLKRKEKQDQKVAIAQQLVTSISSTATAVTNALAVSPFILGLSLATSAAAFGAIQIATIRKQLKNLEDGGLLQGKRHKHGGMRIEGTNIEVEGDEYVVNRISTRKNLGLISYINKNRKELSPDDVNNYFMRTGSGNQAERSFSTRQMYEEGGQLTNLEVMDAMNAPNNDKILEAISQINFKPVVSVVDIASAQSNVTEVKDIAGV